MREEVESLLHKEMDRRDFLRHVGIGLIALTGITALLRSLSGSGSNQQSQPRMGYGGSSYGGKNAPRLG